jgi:redox-sensitive bicupin YhaK (pirin superfamily)
VYEGEIEVGGDTAVHVTTNRLVRLSDEGQLTIRSSQGARVLLIAGAPLNEPIVQYGPFVMNTREQIEQALQDYQRGEFGQ